MNILRYLYRNHFLTTKKCRESRHFGTNPSKNPTPIISSQIESAKGLTRDYKELKLLIRDALEIKCAKEFYNGGVSNTTMGSLTSKLH
jgi:hypothetical protein